MSEPTVSAGMGQEALLALLEARVTDLCAQLDNIDPELRDAIFLVSVCYFVCLFFCFIRLLLSLIQSVQILEHYQNNSGTKLLSFFLK